MPAAGLAHAANVEIHYPRPGRAIRANDARGCDGMGVGLTISRLRGGVRGPASPKSLTVASAGATWRGVVAAPYGPEPRRRLMPARRATW